ncbi:MAG: peptidylprolyl isomerase [Acidobacteriota bacterium]
MLNRKSIALIFLLAGLLLLGACTQPQNTNQPSSNQANSNQAQPAPAPKGKNHIAVLETDAGIIKFELFESDAPKTTENFIKLAEKNFYNGLIFHRVIKGFMIQGGDPQGNGTGGQTWNGKDLPNEIKLNSPLYQKGGYSRGVVAMANKGLPQTATSQFFIMHQSRPFQSLPPNYTIFGQVVSGMDVVDKIVSAPVNGDRPIAPVKMKKVYIEN